MSLFFFLLLVFQFVFDRLNKLDFKLVNVKKKEKETRNFIKLLLEQQIILFYCKTINATTTKTKKKKNNTIS